MERFLHWAGERYGKNHSEYLVCPECERIYPVVGGFDEWPEACEDCGEVLHVRLPDEEILVINWRSWKTRQKWWPQKFYVMGSLNPEDLGDKKKLREGYQYWAFAGKEWFKKPYEWGIRFE